VCLSVFIPRDISKTVAAGSPNLKVPVQTNVP